MNSVEVNTQELPALPVALYASFPIGVLQGNGEEFSIQLGLDEGLVAQLKERSLDLSDTDIQNNTSDRARFGEGSYEEWYSKQRTPFVLVHQKTGALAALVWFGPKPLGRKSLKYLSTEEKKNELLQQEDTWHTLVYRSYSPHRGKGLMTTFVATCIEMYRALYPNAKLWVGLSGDNEASARLATKLGFTRREDLVDTEKNWFAMTLES